MPNILRDLLTSQLYADSRFAELVKLNSKIFNPNEKIMENGKTYPYFCFIDKGKVRIVIKEGDPHVKKFGSVIAEISDDDIFGEFGLFDDKPAGADIIAISETRIIHIDKESFLAFLAENTHIGYQVLFEMLGYLVKKLRDENKIVGHIISSAIELQIAAKQ